MSQLTSKKGRRGDSSAMRSAFVVCVVCYEDYTKKKEIRQL